MIMRVDAIHESGLLCPLEQLELEVRQRIALTMAALEDEFEREFGAARPPATPISAGPVPWGGFLDLSTL